MATTQGRSSSSATSSPEDAARRRSFGRLNEQVFIDGPVTEAMMGRVLERLARAAARRPTVVLGIVLALAVVGGALATGLQPDTNSDTFISRS